MGWCARGHGERDLGHGAQATGVLWAFYVERFAYCNFWELERCNLGSMLGLGIAKVVVEGFDAL